MPKRTPELTEKAFAAALRAAGLALPKPERAAVLQTARWLHQSVARVASYLAVDENPGAADAPR